MDSLTIIMLILGVLGSLGTIFYILDLFKKNKKLTWKDVKKASEKIFNEMARDGFKPTLIIGIGRGGAIMGSLISGLFGHIPLVVIDRKYTWLDGRRFDDLLLKIQFPEELTESVLLISGENLTGNTMRTYYSYFKNLGVKNLKTATFFHLKSSIEKIDYIGIEGFKDLRMPWMISKNYVRDNVSEEEFKKISKSVMDNKNDRIIYLIRHGESVSNFNNSFSGITDVELTEKGIKQAERISDFLFSEHIDRIYSSPLKRAKDFARIIQKKIGTKLIIDQRLIELDYGEWEGMEKNEILEKYNELYKKYTDDPESFRPPNSEDLQSAENRITEFWNEIKFTMLNENLKKIAVITHKDIGRILICKIKKLPIKEYRNLEFDNGGITEIKLENFSEIIIYENKIV